MRTIVTVTVLIGLGQIVGCGPRGPAESAVPPTSELHGGILVPLSDDLACVELLNAKREKKGNVFQTDLVAYLLQPDGKTAFAETPTSVEVKLGTPKGEQVVPLKAAPDASDPLGTCRYASAPGPFELNQTGGEVTVKLPGKTLTGKFRGPR
jgi:hypothetical protein